MNARAILLAAALWPSAREALARRADVIGPLDGQGTFAERARTLAPADAARVGAIATIGSVPIDDDTLALFPSLGLVCCAGSGYEGVDLAAARARGVAVAHSGNANAASVAEVALGLMIASVRGFRAASARLEGGAWPGNATAGLPIRRGLEGLRLGIYGMGAIGMAIAQRAEPFGMQVGYHNRRPRADTTARHFPTLTGLAQWCDVLVVSVRADAATRHAVDAGVLAALGADGHVINIARGNVIDEAALIDALREGVIAGAGLDVFEHEPAVPPALLALPNVVALPHIGGASRQARDAMQAMLLANVDAWLAGAPLPAPVHA